MASTRMRLSPVVIVPGTGGNQLEAKLTEEYKAAGSNIFAWYYYYHYYYYYNRVFNKKEDSGYFRLWLDVLSLFPPFMSFFSECRCLEYDAQINQYGNLKGVETRVPSFGSIDGMDHLDPNFKSVSAYMMHLVNALTNKGYERGRTLFGAPYDFRYAPGPHASAVARNYLTDLKGLIEQAYTANDNQPVVLLSHSMGALWSLYFLNNQQMEWRQKFVAHFVTIAAPWGGTVEQMMTFASGNSVGVPFVDPLVVRKEQRSSESNLWLLPVSWVFGKHRPLVISSSGRSYTAADMKDFLHDITTPAGFAATTAAADLHQSCNHLVTAYESRVPHLTEKTSLRAPRVPVTLIYGHGVPTAEMLSYEEKSSSRSSSKLGFDCVPKIVQGDGDGTVNLCSLTAVIQEWGGTPGQILEVIALSNKSHRKILLDKESLEVIVNVILNTTTTTTTTTTTAAPPPPTTTAAAAATTTPQQQDSVLMQS